MTDVQGMKDALRSSLAEGLRLDAGRRVRVKRAYRRIWGSLRRALANRRSGGGVPE